MSGDNLYGDQFFKFYSEEMTETKKIALAHLEKQLFFESNSISHFHQKPQELNVLDVAWEVPGAA